MGLAAVNSLPWRHLIFQKNLSNMSQDLQNKNVCTPLNIKMVPNIFVSYILLNSIAQLRQAVPSTV
jgi:hypothetical protein